MINKSCHLLLFSMMNLGIGGLTILLVTWMSFQADCTTMAQSTGDHKPQVKINMVVKKPTNPLIDVNSHLKKNSRKDDPAWEKASPTKFLGDQSISSVIFNEIELLVLTKSSFQIVSYISFKSHLSAFSHISGLLQQTLEKTETFLQAKSFPPYYRALTGESKFIQNLKDDSIRIQLNELAYEVNLVTRNFESIKMQFSQMTGHDLNSKVTNKTGTPAVNYEPQGQTRRKQIINQ